MSDDDRFKQIEAHIIGLWSTIGLLSQSMAANSVTQFVFDPQTMDVAFDYRLLDTGALGPWQQPRQQAKTYS